jgi:hypothetical protein
VWDQLASFGPTEHRFSLQGAFDSHITFAADAPVIVADGIQVC